MKKIVTAKEAYDSMCAKFLKRKMYDGRGTIDIYECHDCDHMEYTTYIHKGVTPFCIKCIKCGGMMSHVRTLPVMMIPVTIEWYRPTFEEYEKLSEAMKEHIRNGGLIKRVIQS